MKSVSVIYLIIFQPALFGKKFLVELEDGPKKESKLSAQKMEEMETSTLKTEGKDYMVGGFKGLYLYLYKPILPNLSRRRASAQAVTLKQYIRTTSPVNTYSSGVKTDSRRKTGRSTETKRATGDRWVPKRPKFRCRRRRRFGFFRWWPKTGRFGCFSGSRGSKWDVHFLMLSQKERCAGWSEWTKLILFQYD